MWSPLYHVTFSMKPMFTNRMREGDSSYLRQIQCVKVFKVIGDWYVLIRNCQYYENNWFISTTNMKNDDKPETSSFHDTLIIHAVLLRDVWFSVIISDSSAQPYMHLWFLPIFVLCKDKIKQLSFDSQILSLASSHLN